MTRSGEVDIAAYDTTAVPVARALRNPCLRYEVGPRGGSGVGVGLPRYLRSMVCRISPRERPAARIVITSRVTSRHVVQVAAWLVKVIVPSGFVAFT